MSNYEYASPNEINKLFVRNCSEGNLEEVIFLLNNTHPYQKIDDSFRTENNDTALSSATRNGHLEIVTVLLDKLSLRCETNEYNEKINSAFNVACSNGQLKIVENLKDKADVYANNLEAFRYACIARHQNVINYFLYDLKIKITGKFEHYLREDILNTIATKKLMRGQVYIENPQDNEKVNFQLANFRSLFHKRDLYFKLNEEMSHDSLKIKTKKI